MKNWLKTLYLDLTALLLGAALAFAFAPYEIFPLAIIAPAGLLALWLNVSPKHAFYLGLIFGLGFFSAGVYWVFHSIHVFGDVPIPIAMLITGALIAALACFPAAVGYFTNRYFPVNNQAKLVYAFPAIWVFSEWVRSWLFTGFPWLLLGYSQTNSPLKGYAPILSVYGVTLAVLVSSGLIIQAIRQVKAKVYASAYLSLFAVVTIWVAGGLLNLIPWTKPTGDPISVALIQGNIPQSIKWEPDHVQLSFDRYESLTQPLWGKNKLIVWPEAAIPMPLAQASQFINAMDDKAKASNSQLILGIPIATPDSNGYFNAVVTLGKYNRVYSKRRLVPFGEYVPSLRFLPRLYNFMDIPMSDMVPGKPKQPPLMFENIKILTAICYEIAYPELINSADRTIGFLLTVTNDAWFGDSSAQAQHLQMAEMRAIELKRPLLFASNDGITAIVNADGNVVSAAPAHEVFVLNGSIQPVIGLTPWMRNGSDPILFIALVLIIAAIRSKIKSENTNGRTI